MRKFPVKVFNKFDFCLKHLTGGIFQLRDPSDVWKAEEKYLLQFTKF
jgi:hypothetical protein